VASMRLIALFVTPGVVSLIIYGTSAIITCS
jgi:hypothetical protein